mmetsp:Transcript_3687/g.10128  ORF Transcript_3687/g.10128 Transcript_3687/m.10128 type:complete len:552 (-) Transcript_3687:132-1787(-)
MSVSFLASSSSSPLLHGVTVSRMGPVRRLNADWSRKPPSRKKATDVMFAAQPIEDTLRKRQALQPSRSAPSLDTFHEREPLVLPRISVARRKAPSAGIDSPDQFLHASIPSADQSHLSSKATQKLGTDQESWLSMLNGGRRVGIPFSTFGGSSIDTDVFVHWYRSEQDEAQHQQSLQSMLVADETFWPVGEMWAHKQGDALSRLQRAPKGSGQALRLQAEVDLFQYLDTLEDGAPRQGFGALLDALAFKLGSEDKVYKMLNFEGRGELSLMEFAGCMDLLGLDVDTLCGCDVQTAFRSLDEDQSGVISLHDLLNSRHRQGNASKKASSAESTPPSPRARLDREQVVEKWVRVAKWMAIAARRSAALREQRYLRGWRVNDADETVIAPGCRETGIGLDDQSSTSAAASGAIPNGTQARSGNMCRYRALPEDVLLETAAILREKDKQLRAAFVKSASISLQDGTKVMSRIDLHRFFSDLSIADPQRSQAATQHVIDQHYQDTLILQFNYIKIGDGLVFWSFKALLNNITKSLRLGWRGLVEQTIEVSRGELIA